MRLIFSAALVAALIAGVDAASAKSACGGMGQPRCDISDGAAKGQAQEGVVKAPKSGGKPPQGGGAPMAVKKQGNPTGPAPPPPHH